MLKRIFPFLKWFDGYNQEKLRADFVSGLTVALVLIPQSMAYAQLAGLPAYYGLYAAFLPPMVASLFGSSRQLATGPVAVVSLMTAATLEPLATAGGEAYIVYAILLAFLVGLFQFALGVFRLGVLVNFLSHPVVIGFTNAAAIIIATSQLDKLFGVTVDSAEHHYQTVWHIFLAAGHYIHWPTFLLGALAFGLMFGLKRLNPRLPYVLAAVALTTMISWAMGLEDNAKATAEDIQAPEVRTLIEDFNANIGLIDNAVEARVLLNPKVDEIDNVHGNVCSACHSERPIDTKNLERKALPDDQLSGKALELHIKAGLFGNMITQRREKVRSVKEQLRNALLERVKDSSGKARFYLKGHCPPDTKSDGSVWRLKVGNKPIAPGALTLSRGGSVVGKIPIGLPGFSPPRFDFSIITKLLAAAAIISILGFMEAISIAKAMAAKTGQRLDPNQELIGQGLANMMGSFTHSYAVSGSFSRSAVNIQSGAVTGFSSVFTSIIVVITLLFLTPLLYYLPQSVLAAIIMMAVVGLVNVKGVLHSWKVQRSDGIIAVISFTATLVFAPHLDKGILLGVALSMGVFFYRRMRPKIAELSLWRDGHFRNAKRFRLKQCKYISVIRFDGPLFFANTSYLEDEILERTRSMTQLKTILFKGDAINELDASGEEILALMIARLRSAGIDVNFCGLNEQVLDVLRRAHLYERIGEDHIFPKTDVALEAIWAKAHQGSDEKDCPLKIVVPETGPAEPYRVKVLLVDDEKDYVDMLAKRLELRNFIAKPAHDAHAALALLDGQVFDVAVLDVFMPGIGGLELLGKIRRRGLDMPVLLITGHATVESAIQGLKLGASDYLQKPCDIADLVGKIKAILTDTPDSKSK